MGGAKIGHAVSDETKAKISATMTGVPQGPSPLRGRKLSPEHKAKIVRRKYPPICTIEGCERKHLSRGWCSTHWARWKATGTTDDPAPRVGERAGRWTGDDVGYVGMHRRAVKTLPKVCRSCGETNGRLEAALLKTADPENLREHLNQKGVLAPFSIRVDDYVRLCLACHRRYDSPIPATSAGIVTALG